MLGAKNKWASQQNLPARVPSAPGSPSPIQEPANWLRATSGCTGATGPEAPEGSYSLLPFFPFGQGDPLSIRGRGRATGHPDCLPRGENASTKNFLLYSYDSQRQRTDKGHPIPPPHFAGGERREPPGPPTPHPPCSKRREGWGRAWPALTHSDAAGVLSAQAHLARRPAPSCRSDPQGWMPCRYRGRGPTACRRGS